MKKKRVLSLLLATAMIVSLAAGCGSGGGGSENGEEQVTLTILAGQSTTDAGIEDMIDEAMAEKYPEYGFERHAGYGTKEHVAALEKFGPTPIHRKTFEPVKSLLRAREEGKARESGDE